MEEGKRNVIAGDDKDGSVMNIHLVFHGFLFVHWLMRVNLIVVVNAYEPAPHVNVLTFEQSAQKLFKFGQIAI